MFVNNPSIGQRRKLELEFQCDVDDENNGESTSGGEMTGSLGIYDYIRRKNPNLSIDLLLLLVEKALTIYLF